MYRSPGKIGALMVLCCVVPSMDASAGSGRKPTSAPPATRTMRPGGIIGQAVRVAPRIPGVPGIPGMSIPGMPHIPGMPGLPGVTSLPGLIGKLR